MAHSRLKHPDLVASYTRTALPLTGGDVPRDFALTRAIAAAGGVCQLVRALGVSPQAVAQWGSCPPSRVIAVEEISGVSRHHLRPDMHPEEHAPSLSDEGADDQVAAIGAHWLLPKTWRLASGLTLDAAAKMAGVRGVNPARTWQRWEEGEREPPLAVIVAVEEVSGGAVRAVSWLWAGRAGEVSPPRPARKSKPTPPDLTIRSDDPSHHLAGAA